MKTHLTDTPYYVNGGIRIPLCVANRRGPLDLDTGRWPQSNDVRKVTCAHCLAYWKRGAA